MAPPKLFKVLDDQEIIDPHKLIFKKCTNLWEVRYRESPNSRSQSIYLSTPIMRLVSLDCDEDNYFMIFHLDEERKNHSTFIETMINLDLSVIQEMFNEMSFWNFPDDTPISIIETSFRPTLRRSIICDGDHAFYLVISKSDDIAFYDQNKKQIDVEDLAVGNDVAMLLLFIGVMPRKVGYQLEFGLEQMRQFDHKEDDESEEEEDKKKALKNVY